MGESKNNALNQNIKYVFILIGFLAIVFSYLFVFQKFNTKTSDVNDEKDVLTEKYKKVSHLNDRRKKFKTDTEDNLAKADQLLSKFDGGVTDQSEIMYLFNATNDTKMNVSTINFKEYDETTEYHFGNVTVSDPDQQATGGMDNSYTGVTKKYSIIADGSYDQMKNFLNQILFISGKRIVPTTISCTYDTSTSTVTLKADINEYAIFGDNRMMQEVIIPPFNTSTTNIFYSSLTPSTAQ